MSETKSALLAGVGYALMGIGMVTTLVAIFFSREHESWPGSGPQPAWIARAIVVGPLLAMAGLALFTVAMP